MLKDYKTIEKPTEITLEIKKSKFIAAVCPVETEEEAQQFIEQIRKKHYNATHNVFAYQVGLKQEIKRYSDDGEPSGTAGLPILDILERGEIKNTAIVVTRYFGGTLLGTGGLVKAYGQSAKEGVLAAQIIERIVYCDIAVVVDYTLMGKVQNETLNAGHIIYGTVFEDKVKMKIYVLPTQLEAFKKAIVEITSAKVEFIQEADLYLVKKDDRIIYE